MTRRHPPVEDWATDFDHTDPAWVADPSAPPSGTWPSTPPTGAGWPATRR